MKKVLLLISYFCFQSFLISNPRKEIIWTAAHLIKTYGTDVGFSTESNKVAIFVSTDRKSLRFWIPYLHDSDIKKLKESAEVKKFVTMVAKDFQAKKPTTTYRIVDEMDKKYIYANIYDDQIESNLSAFETLKNRSYPADSTQNNPPPTKQKKISTLTKKMADSMLKQLQGGS